MCKIVRSGSGFNTSLSVDLDDKKNKKSIYNANVVRVALEGYYDKEPAIKKYKRKDIFRIIKSAEENLLKIRYGISQSEIRLLLDVFLFGIMKDSLNYTDLETIRKIPFA